MNEPPAPAGATPTPAKRDHRRGLRPISWLLCLVALVLAGQAGLRALSLPGIELDRSPSLEALWADAGSPAIGPHSATVQVVVFTDYQCAACRADHQDVEAEAQSGNARFVFKEWAILGPASVLAARAALAARYQERYSQMRNALMRGPGPPDLPKVLTAARRAGVDTARLELDLVSHKRDIDRELARVALQSFSLGLRGTPTYLIGRRLVVGTISARQLRRLIVHEQEAAANPAGPNSAR